MSARMYARFSTDCYIGWVVLGFPIRLKTVRAPTGDVESCDEIMLHTALPCDAVIVLFVLHPYYTTTLFAFYCHREKY